MTSNINILFFDRKRIKKLLAILNPTGKNVEIVGPDVVTRVLTSAPSLMWWVFNDYCYFIYQL